MCNGCSDLPRCAWRRVQAGESLTEIAGACHTTPARLLELNPFIDPAELIEGMPLIVPDENAFARVRYGERLEQLQARLGLERAALLQANPALAEGLLPGRRVYRG